MLPNAGMTPEYSYLLVVDSLGPGQKKLTLVADEASRAALATRFELVSIDNFTANLVVRRIPKTSMVRVDGFFAADIVQACVVTNEPVPEHIEEPVSGRFGPEEALPAEVEFDPEEEDPPEPFHGNAIELGEWLSEYLAISMEPYPRVPGAELELLTDEAESEDSDTHRPFESLLAPRKPSM